AVDGAPAVLVLDRDVPAAGLRAPGVGDLALAGGHHPGAGRRHEVDAAMKLPVPLQPADAERRRDLLEAADVDGKEEPGHAARRCVRRRGEDQPSGEHRDAHAAPAKKSAAAQTARLFLLAGPEEAAMGLFARFWHYSIDTYGGAP